MQNYADNENSDQAAWMRRLILAPMSEGNFSSAEQEVLKASIFDRSMAVVCHTSSVSGRQLCVVRRNQFAMFYRYVSR